MCSASSIGTYIANTVSAVKSPKESMLVSRSRQKWNSL